MSNKTKLNLDYREKLFLKLISFSICFMFLKIVEKLTSFEVAVLFGLALNSADINEARERLSQNGFEFF